jgi:hypothetical protein
MDEIVATWTAMSNESFATGDNRQGEQQAEIAAGFARIAEAERVLERYKVSTYDWFVAKSLVMDGWMRVRQTQRDTVGQKYYNTKANCYKTIADYEQKKSQDPEYGYVWQWAHGHQLTQWAIMSDLDDKHDEAENKRLLSAAYIKLSEVKNNGARVSSPEYYTMLANEQLVWAEIKDIHGKVEEAKKHRTRSTAWTEISSLTRQASGLVVRSPEHYEVGAKEYDNRAVIDSTQGNDAEVSRFETLANAFRTIANAERTKLSTPDGSIEFLNAQVAIAQALAQIDLVNGDRAGYDKNMQAVTKFESQKAYSSHRRTWYGPFSVYLSEEADSFVEIDGNYVKHIKPFRDGTVPYTLPRQTMGTCYFFAALNAVLNESAFLAAFVTHIERQIRKSKYSRKDSESIESANQRRFGKAVAHRLTYSGDFAENTKESMQQVFDDISHSNDLFLWSRHVIMFHTLKAALRREGAGSKAYDSRASIFMKDWSLDDAVQNKFDNALKEVGNGGKSIPALEQIFKLSGLITRRENDALVATIPGSGETLCIGSHTSSTDNRSKSDGSYSGFFRMSYGSGNSYVGHMNAYVGSNLAENPKLLESNGGLHTLSENLDYWKRQNDVWTDFQWSPMYTCKLDSAMYGGGSEEADLSENDMEVARLQAAALVPSDATVLADCDEVCDLDEDLAAALFTAKSFAMQEVSDVEQEVSDADQDWPVEHAWDVEQRDNELLSEESSEGQSYPDSKQLGGAKGMYNGVVLLGMSMCMALLGGYK